MGIGAERWALQIGFAHPAEHIRPLPRNSLYSSIKPVLHLPFLPSPRRLWHLPSLSRASALVSTGDSHTSTRVLSTPQRATTLQPSERNEHCSEQNEHISERSEHNLNTLNARMNRSFSRQTQMEDSK